MIRVNSVDENGVARNYLNNNLDTIAIDSIT